MTYENCASLAPGSFQMFEKNGRGRELFAKEKVPML
jgi:hypothetical protein